MLPLLVDCRLPRLLHCAVLRSEHQNHHIAGRNGAQARPLRGTRQRGGGLADENGLMAESLNQAASRRAKLLVALRHRRHKHPQPFAGALVPAVMHGWPRPSGHLENRPLGLALTPIPGSVTLIPDSVTFKQH